MKLRQKREFVLEGDKPRAGKAFKALSALKFKRKVCDFKKRSNFYRFSVDKTQ